MSYAIELRLEGKQVLVAGGDRLALAHVEQLLAAGARPRIVAPAVATELADLAQRHGLALERRPFADGDLDGAWLVLALTDDAAANARICELADRQGKLTYGDGQHGNIALPAIVRRGDLTIAVSTRVPHLARTLVLELEEDYGPEFVEYAHRLEAACARIAQEVPDALERQRLVHRVTSPAVLALVRSGDRKEWQRMLDTAVEARSAEASGQADAARTEVETL